MNQTQCAERVAKLVPEPGIGITVQEYFRIYENKYVSGTAVVPWSAKKMVTGCFVVLLASAFRRRLVQGGFLICIPA